MGSVIFILEQNWGTFCWATWSTQMLYSNYWFLVLLKDSLITCIKSNLKVIKMRKHEEEHLISFPQILKSPICQVTGFMDIFWCCTMCIQAIFSFLKELIISNSLTDTQEKEKADFQPPPFLLSLLLFFHTCTTFLPTPSPTPAQAPPKRPFPPPQPSSHISHLV